MSYLRQTLRSRLFSALCFVMFSSLIVCPRPVKLLLQEFALTCWLIGRQYNLSGLLSEAHEKLPASGSQVLRLKACYEHAQLYAALGMDPGS